MIEQITVTAKRESNGKLRITTTTEEIVNQILSDEEDFYVDTSWMPEAFGADVKGAYDEFLRNDRDFRF